jgi:hypothetical protein
MKKKRKLNSLTLNKKSISNLRTQNEVIGGFKTESCQPFGICGPTNDANCPDPSADGTCGGGGVTVTNNQACGIATVSCPGNGIC